MEQVNSTTKLLSEVSMMASGGTPDRKSKDYWNGDIPWVTTAEVSEYQYILDTKEKITELGLKNSSAKLFPKESILLALYGQGKTRGKVALLGIPATTNQACLAIQPDNSLLTTKYLYYYLENSYEKLRKMANSGGQDNLSMSILKEFPISFPDLSTQEYRVKLFDKLSEKIQLQQEKINLLKEQKKGFMQKIFSQKLRFKDEDGQDYPSWTKRKLSSFAERVTRKNSELLTTRPLTISAQYGLIDQTEFFNKTVASVNLTGYYLLQKGEFAYNKSYSNGFPLGTIKRLDTYENGALSTLYICFLLKDNVDSDFLVHYFDSSQWHKEVSLICVEGARNHGLLNVSVSEFFETQHYLPCLKEQVKIAEFFNKINKKIQFNEQILINLQYQKQAFMQQMFI